MGTLGDVEILGCTGACCAPVKLTPAVYATVRRHWTAQNRYINDMLTRSQVRGGKEIVDGDALLHFHCKWYNSETHLCENYEERPDMCRSFPYGKVCYACGLGGGE